MAYVTCEALSRWPLMPLMPGMPRGSFHLRHGAVWCSGHGTARHGRLSCRIACAGTPGPQRRCIRRMPRVYGRGPKKQRKNQERNEACVCVHVCGWECACVCARARSRGGPLNKSRLRGLGVAKKRAFAAPDPTARAGIAAKVVAHRAVRRLIAGPRGTAPAVACARGSRSGARRRHTQRRCSPARVDRWRARLVRRVARATQRPIRRGASPRGAKEG